MIALPYHNFDTGQIEWLESSLVDHPRLLSFVPRGYREAYQYLRPMLGHHQAYSTVLTEAFLRQDEYHQVHPRATNDDLVAHLEAQGPVYLAFLQERK